MIDEIAKEQVRIDNSVSKAIESIRDSGYDCIVIKRFVLDSIKFFDETSKYKFYGIHNMLKRWQDKREKIVWHDFSKEKPERSGFYVCITKLEYGGYMVADHLYHAESGLFNWDGKGEDTSISVDFWAEIEDVVTQAKGIR